MSSRNVCDNFLAALLCTENTFILLFKSLVRPILEYGHAVWQPHQKGLCSEIEDVQRRATKMLPKLKDKPYTERLKTLNLPTLEHRRLRGDMIECYKYIHRKYKTVRPHLTKADNQQRQLRGHSLKLKKTCSRLNLRTNYFSNRIISTWNSLPDEVVTAQSVNAFKNQLDNHWKDYQSVFHPKCQE